MEQAIPGVTEIFMFVWFSLVSLFAHFFFFAGGIEMEIKTSVTRKAYGGIISHTGPERLL